MSPRPSARATVIKGFNPISHRLARIDQAIEGRPPLLNLRASAQARVATPNEGIFVCLIIHQIQI